MTSLDQLALEVVAWQQHQFPHRTAHSIATHLSREAAELVAVPNDAEEMADIFMLLVGAADRSGVNLINAVAAKLEKNKARTWGTPDADGVVSHVEQH